MKQKTYSAKYISMEMNIRRFIRIMMYVHSLGRENRSIHAEDFLNVNRLIMFT